MPKPRPNFTLDARYRVQPPKPKFSIPRSAPIPLGPPAPSGPSLLKKKRLQFPAFFAGLRQWFSRLPSPIRRAGRTLRWLAPAIPISIFFSEHAMQVMWVSGPSMTPYLNEDYEQSHTKSDMVLVKRWSWEFLIPFQMERKLQRGMVVTFRSPANPSHIAIKRIVGLPGDRVTTRWPCLRPTQIVPYNHVWVEGDAADPGKTMDSNTYGPVSLNLLVGRAVAVWGPRMRWLDWSDWENGKDETASAYRQDVRDRVVKDAVKLEQPS